MIFWRSSGVIGPMRLDGGRIMVRSTMVGIPLRSSTETSASPLPSCVMASSVLKAGLARKVEAACRFVEATGGRAAIGSLGAARQILRGEAGTTVVREAGA